MRKTILFAALAAVLSWAPSTVGAGEAAAGLTAGEAFEVAPAAEPLQCYPQAAGAKGAFLVVWQDGWTGLDGEGRIRGSLVRDGKPDEAFDVSSGQDVCEKPAVAAAGDGFVVAWQVLRDGRDADVRAARVSADGKVLDAEGIAVAGGEGTQSNPTVASDGAGFLVAWQSTEGNATYRVEARRFSAEGKGRDEKPLALGEGDSPAAAFGGGKYLIAWSTGAEQGATVQGAMVGAEGAPGAAFPIMKICTLAPSVAAGTKGFVVIASCKPAPNPWGWGGPAAFAAARVTFEGRAPDAGTDYGYYNKGLAARTSPNILDSSRWKRKNGAWPAGQVGGFSGTENDQWPHLYSAVAADGDGFVAVWVSRKIRNRWMLHDADVFGSRFSSDPWKVEEVGGVKVAASETNEGFPALASDGTKVLAVYQAVTPKGVQVLGRMLKAE